MIISDTDLQALIDAEAKATKGQHRVGELPQNLHAVILDVSPGKIIELARFSFDHDAHLYATLRNAAPSLLAELRASREMIAKLHEALTPSAETKAAYIGEFSFDETPDDHFGGPVTRTVPWTTIKEIMAKIRDRAALASKGER